MTDCDQLRTHAENELRRWRVPAMELVVVRGGETVLAEAFGRRDVDQGLAATPTTLFHHGSTGKAFTGVLVGTLVDDGLLAWDRPVREYLPDFRLHDAVLTERVTVTDLLSHRSGLARHEFVWLANPSWSRAELVHRLRYLKSPLDLRTTFEYSNLAYVTVGHLVAAVTGSTWEEQMRSRVLDPLGMTHSVTSVDEAQAREHARPYAPPGWFGAGTKRPRAIPWRRSDQIAPAGQMISCAQDIARWLRFLLSDGEVDGRRIISSANLAETKRLRTPLDVPGPDPDIYFYGYAFGWLVGTYRGRRLMWHNGGIDGFKTDIAFLPDDGIAAAASCNVFPSDMTFGMVFHALDVMLGEEPKPWSETLRAGAASAPAPEEPAVVSGTQPSHRLKDYTGEYGHPGYGTLRIEARGRGLRVRLGELDLTARYRHYDTWTVHYGAISSTWPLTFLTNVEGRICAAEIPLEPSIEPIRFEVASKEMDG